jgi:hypothetical protein
MNIIPKIPKIIECVLCDYKTSNNKDYNKHLHTNKHINRTKMNNLEQKNPENPKNFIKLQKIMLQKKIVSDRK